MKEEQKKWHVKPLKVPSNNMIGFWIKHIMSDNVFKQRAESKLFSKCRRESREPEEREDRPIIDNGN